MLASQASFALDILQQTGGFNASTIFSPLSILMALDLVLFGARNNTATEIQNVIGKGWFLIA